MGTRAKVWLVTDGDYSEFHVVGVFSTEEKADRFVAMFGGCVEAWHLDPFAKEIRAGVRAYSIRMEENGDVRSLCIEGLPEDHSPQFFHYEGEFIGTIHAKSEEYAIKIANDKRRAIIADPTREEY